jgi:cytolysin-activating lysine-acyltransferase
MTDVKKDSSAENENQKLEAEFEAAFSKLPTLGPVAWLYGRTQDRRFLFLSDLDWAVMPPITLDQCRLFMKGKMPFAFITWAFVSDEVHQRLLGGLNKLAPHEWKSGNHLWLIDVVTPFGSTNELLADLHQLKFKDQANLPYLRPNLVTQKFDVHYFQPPAAKEVNAASVAAQSSTKAH